MTSPSQTLSTRSWLEIGDYQYPAGWSAPHPGERSLGYCRELEAGRILFFPEVPFDLPADDIVHFEQYDFEFSQKLEKETVHRAVHSLRNL